MIIYLFIQAVALVIGHVFTETRWRIPSDRKPWACRPCMTFWASFIISFGFWLASQPSYVAAGFAFITALILYFITKAADPAKITP